VDPVSAAFYSFAIGFAFMFSHGNGFIGYHWFFLQGAPHTYERDRHAFLAVWLFQFAFADTGAAHDHFRRYDWPHRLPSATCFTVWGLRIYLSNHGHWAWGPDGWLALMAARVISGPDLEWGFHDFAVRPSFPDHRRMVAPR